MKSGRTMRLPDKYRPLVFLITFVFNCCLSYGQNTYRPSNSAYFTTSNKPYGVSSAAPTDGRTYKADTINGLFRPYNGTSEVLSYLPLGSQYRVGQFPVVVNVGGSLQSNGTFIGGQIQVWWFLQGQSNANLVRMDSAGAGTCTGCLLSTNNLSDVLSASASRTNLGLGNMSTQTTAAGGDLSGSFWPNITVAKLNGQFPSFYLNYNNLTNTPTIPAQFNPIAGANVFLSGTYPNITFSATTGGGTPCLNCNADSLKHLPVDTTTNRNGYVITFDSANHKWFLSPNGSGTGITQLTGDILAGPGSGSQTATLPIVNSSPGTFGTANQVAIVTVNGKGLSTLVANIPIQISEGQVTNLTTDLSNKLSTSLSSTHLFVGNISNIAVDGGADFTWNQSTLTHCIGCSIASNAAVLTGGGSTGSAGGKFTIQTQGSPMYINGDSITYNTTPIGAHIFKTNGTYRLIIDDYGKTSIFDTLFLPNYIAKTDTTNYKPLVADASGNVFRSTVWGNGGGGTGTTNLGYAQYPPYDSVTSSTGTGVRLLPVTSSLAGLADTVMKHLSDSLHNRTYTFPTSTLTYTQNATNNNLAITNGNNQNFLPATSSLAGLLDTARAKKIDSITNQGTTAALSGKYQLLSQKSQANGYAPLNSIATVSPPFLGTGGLNANQNLYEDGTWRSASSQVYYKVGQAGYSNPGDTTYTNSILAHYQVYLVSRGNSVLFPDSIQGFRVDSSTGTIFFNPALASGEKINIYALYGQPGSTGLFKSPNLNIVPNLIAWYDANVPSSVVPGTGVAQLSDLTPNNRNLVQATGGNQPVYSATGGINNLAYIQFSPGHNLNFNFPTNDTAAHTCYFVMKNPTITSNSRFFGTNPAGGSQGIVQSAVGFGTYNSFYTYDGTANGAFDLNTNFGDWMLIKVVFRGGGVGFINKGRLGGWSYNAQNAAAGTPTSQIFTHMQFGDASSNFQLGAAVIVRGEPTTANDNFIRSALISEFGITPRPIAFLFGNSHFAGVMSGTPTGEPCTNIAFQTKGYDIMDMAVASTVVWPNAGWQGITGRNLSDQYNAYDSYISSLHPVVIFEFGTNDGNNVTNSTWLSNYTTYINHIVSLGVPKSKIFLCTPPYNSNTVAYPYMATATTVITNLASTLGVGLIDFYNYLHAQGLDCATVPGGDGTHGNAPIHAAMATLIENTIP